MQKGESGSFECRKECSFIFHHFFIRQLFKQLREHEFSINVRVHFCTDVNGHAEAHQSFACCWRARPILQRHIAIGSNTYELGEDCFLERGAKIHRLLSRWCKLEQIVKGDIWDKDLGQLELTAEKTRLSTREIDLLNLSPEAAFPQFGYRPELCDYFKKRCNYSQFSQMIRKRLRLPQSAKCSRSP